MTSETGSRAQDPDSRSFAIGRAVRNNHQLPHIEEIALIHESRVKPLATLAREQGVQPLQRIEDLQGEPIEDFEEFLAAVESARHDA